MPGHNYNHVTIVGGGIAGLACAYRLQQLGVPFTLLEAEGRAGGFVGTVERDGFLFESGPQSFQGTEVLLELARQLGIEDKLQPADPKAPRYVVLHGHLQEVPMSPKELLTSSLLGTGSRLKLISEALRRTRPPEQEESVASFVRRKFGHEILEYLVSPFVSGVYAGDPEQLSLRAAFPTLDEWERTYGSVLRGAMKSGPKQQTSPPALCSFEGGMETLPKTIAKKLGENVRVHARAISLRRSGSGTGFDVRVAQGGSEESLATDTVVLATPAYTAGAFVGSLSSSLAHALSGIAYAPVAVIASGYYRQQIGNPLDGFGFLVPRREKLRTLGTVWNSSLFPGRAGKGTVALTSFAGGATDTGMVAKSEDEIAQIVQDENARVLQISGPPIASAVWRHPRALPQYNLGHGHIVEQIRGGMREIPGLFFSGNYLEGPSLGKCVEQGFQTAEAVQKYRSAIQ
jgi:protoporphyrinogen/coproporphyrinogen III oxidase